MIYLTEKRFCFSFFFFMIFFYFFLRGGNSKDSVKIEKNSSEKEAC